MKRPDIWDSLGLAVVGLLAALWIAHMVLPAAPPDPNHAPPPGVTALGHPLPTIAPPGR